MSFFYDSKPDAIEKIKQTKLTAKEEIYTFINHKASTALIIDYERRYLNSRCIVKEVDFGRKIIKEKRSRTLRFKIKSTFSPLPFSDEALTFTGGGFTASVVKKEKTYRLLAALPEMENTDGRIGLKLDIIFSSDKTKESFNSIYSTKMASEALTGTILSLTSGALIKGGIKENMEKDDYSLRRIWKISSFPLKRSSSSSFIYGKEDEDYSIFFSLVENRCFLLKGGLLTSFPVHEMEKISNMEYVLTGGENTVIHFSLFALTKEKTGPFRKNRTIGYGEAEGRIGTFTFSSAFCSIEM